VTVWAVLDDFYQQFQRELAFQGDGSFATVAEKLAFLDHDEYRALPARRKLRCQDGAGVLPVSMGLDGDANMISHCASPRDKVSISRIQTVSFATRKVADLVSVLTEACHTKP